MHARLRTHTPTRHRVSTSIRNSFLPRANTQLWLTSSPPCSHHGRLAYGLVVGFTAMDRDKRWERIQIAFEGLFGGRCTHLKVPVRGESHDSDFQCAAPVIETVRQHIQSEYAAGRNDEFLLPAVITSGDSNGNNTVPEACVGAGDALVFFDYRADRMRQIVSVVGGVAEPQEIQGSEVKLPEGLLVCQMTRFREFVLKLLFPPVFWCVSHCSWRWFCCVEAAEICGRNHATVTNFF